MLSKVRRIVVRHFLGIAVRYAIDGVRRLWNDRRLAVGLHDIGNPIAVLVL